MASVHFFPSIGLCLNLISTACQAYSNRFPFPLSSKGQYFDWLVMSESTSTLRQRRVFPMVEATIERLSPLRKRVASVDMFTKPKEDYRRTQTATGALVSWVAVALISTLVLWEFLGYVVGWGAYRTELSVDFGISDDVPFNLDITFPRIPCTELHIDNVDASGAQSTHLEQDLYKNPVDINGELVFHGEYSFHAKVASNKKDVPREYDETKDPRSPKFCGNCYVKPHEHHHGYDVPGGLLDRHLKSVHGSACCNTCEDVMKMYDMHRIPRPHMNEIEQCIGEMSRSNPGCNLHGTIRLRKVHGNFHFAPGTSIEYGAFGQLIHQFTLDQLLRFNVSHTINHFSIGDTKVQRFSKQGVRFPLDGTSFATSQGEQAHVKYFIKVVPTSYINGHDFSAEATFSEMPELSYEFAAQTHHVSFPRGFTGTRTPAVIFVFDFYPIKVNHIFQRPPFSRFLVKLCGIAGGLFVVLGFADSVVASIVRRIEAFTGRPLIAS